MACSQYFVTRWMPLLGHEGTRIVLALRALGYFNPRTGERRDEIILNRAELAARVGCSEDTLTRELGTDRATGAPRNPALRHFVEKIQRVRRDPHTGRIWQEANGYRVAMDDPIHPDDWPRVAAHVAAREARAEEAPKTKTPKTQSASPGTPPGTHSADSAPHGASPGTQTAAPPPQNASRLKETLYSSLPKMTGPSAAPPRASPASGGGAGVSSFSPGETAEPDWRLVRQRGAATLKAALEAAQKRHRAASG